jgi:DNA-binding CsgD family transcriptional regulator
LENARNLLKTYVQKIKSNSRIIQSLEGSPPSREQQDLLGELKLSTILTEADWDSFQRQFAKVFPNLMDDLVKKYPSLSPAEVRFLLLTKLEMPTADIANALGISPSSLRVTWFRIRKKLDLPKDFHSSLFFEKYFSEA